MARTFAAIIRRQSAKDLLVHSDIIALNIKANLCEDAEDLRHHKVWYYLIQREIRRRCDAFHYDPVPWEIGAHDYLAYGS